MYNEEDEYPDLEIRRENIHIYRKDRHLASALIVSEIDYVLRNKDNPPGLHQEHQALVNYMKEHQITPASSELFYKNMVPLVEAFGAGYNYMAHLNKIHRIAVDITNVATEDYYGSRSSRFNRASLNSLPRELTNLYASKCCFDEWVRENTYTPVMEAHTQLSQDFHIHSFGNLHLWQHQNDTYLITHSHLIGLRDIVNSWFSTLLYAHIYRDKYKGYDLYAETYTYLRKGALTVQMLGMSAYEEVMKMLPSLTIAQVISQMEGNSAFLNTITNPVLSNSVLGRHILQPIDNVPKVHMLLELSGLWKCFGHPNIDMNASAAAWIAKGCVNKDIDEDIAILLSCTFKREFCRKFYSKHKTWPVLKLGQGVDPVVEKNYRNGTWHEDKSTPWTANMFHNVEFAKNFEFNYHVDVADLIADKSMIADYEQWINEYDRKAYRTNHGHFATRREHKTKNVMLHYLSVPTADVKEIIDLISSGVIPMMWRILVGVAKEREFKGRKARFYAKMCPEMRLYQTCTEANLGDKIFRYIDQQTMTLSEEELIRATNRMTAPVLDIGGSSYVFITVDFSNWCLGFRHDLLWRLFRDFDNLFGLNFVYEFTQIFPQLCTLIFQDRFEPPVERADGKPAEGPRCWHGPMSWMEGQRQKGWTVATTMLILLAANTCGTSANLMGQGDNQVILLKLPPADHLAGSGQTAEQYVDSFLHTLKRVCDKAGIEIKVEETWRSSSLFEYSRRYHYLGVQVSSALKPVSRIASESNETIPSFNSDMSGIYSAGLAIAREDLTCIPAYYVTSFEAAHRLHAEGKVGDGDTYKDWVARLPKEAVTCLLSTTRVLGGLPITIMPQFATRAVQDPLSTNLHLIRSLLHSDSHRRYATAFMTAEYDPAPDFLFLVKDPPSLPLVLPLQPENRVKIAVKEGLPSYVKNPDVQRLFSHEADRATMELLRDLKAIEPCNPRLLCRIYTLSPSGVQDKMIGKFANTRSVQAVAMRLWSNELEVTREIRNLEKAMSVFLRNSMRVSWDYMFRATHDVEPNPHIESEYNVCVTRLAQHMRNTAWRRVIDGITMAPIQEQVRVVPWADLPVEARDRTIVIQRRGNVPCDNMLYKRGSCTPYFGSETKVRAVKAPLNTLEVGSSITCIKLLLELYHWVKGNSELEALLKRLVEDRTSVSWATLVLVARYVYSGSMTHRLSVPTLRKGGMTNQNLALPTHYFITSDTAIIYAKQGKNNTVCYQSVFLHGLSWVSFEHYEGRVHDRVAVYFYCDRCVWEIPEESFTLEKTCYGGFPVHPLVETLTFRENSVKYIGTNINDAVLAYSIHMARAFAYYMHDARLARKSNTFDNRSIEEAVLLPFINLAEFSRCDLAAFLRSYVYYTFALESTSFVRRWTFFNEITSSVCKTPYDALFDCIIRCDLLYSICAFSGCRQTELTPYGKRDLLLTAINKVVSDPIALYRDFHILTPDDPYQLAYRTTRMYLSVNLLPDPLDRMPDSLDEYTNVYSAIEGALPRTVCSDIEATSAVRQAAPASHKQVLSYLAVGLTLTPNCEGGNRPDKVTGRQYRLLSVTPGLTGLWAYISTSPVLAVNIATKRRIITTSDTFGEVYTMLMHWDHTQSLDPGYPHQDTSDVHVLECDPAYIQMDPCNIRYDRGKMMYYSSRRIESAEDILYVVWSPLCPDLPDGSLVLQPIAGLTCPGEVLDRYVYPDMPDWCYPDGSYCLYIKGSVTTVPVIGLRLAPGLNPHLRSDENATLVAGCTSVGCFNPFIGLRMFLSMPAEDALPLDSSVIAAKLTKILSNLRIDATHASRDLPSDTTTYARLARAKDVEDLITRYEIRAMKAYTYLHILRHKEIVRSSFEDVLYHMHIHHGHTNTYVKHCFSRTCNYTKLWDSAHVGDLLAWQLYARVSTPWYGDMPLPHFNFR